MRQGLPGTGVDDVGIVVGLDGKNATVAMPPKAIERRKQEGAAFLVRTSPVTPAAPCSSLPERGRSQAARSRFPIKKTSRSRGPGFAPYSIPVLLLTIACLSGCSSQQLYGVGQGWQRNECNRIIDLQERNRCMASADTSYGEYKRQSEAAGAAKPP
jgi:hypothetical protein